MQRYKAQVDCVAVGGGDGTLISALRGILACGLPLGVIPLGTFNDLARTLEVPADPIEAVGVIAAGKKRWIDVGRVGDSYFVNEASIGISTRIARRQTPEVKKKYGFLGIAGTTLTALRYSRPFTVTVRYDGHEETFRTLQLTIANSHHFGGLLTNKNAAVDDGMLDLYSLEIDSWMQVLPLIGPIVRREIAESKYVRNRKAAAFEIVTTRPRDVFADGEPATLTPAKFEVLPHAVEIFVP
jgi:YegS/Rv2252/BmrU family lipid kinase